MDNPGNHFGGGPVGRDESERAVINIQGLDKADVLAALYNASQPQGLGRLHYDPEPMKKEEAAQILQERSYFDYLKGRVMKVKIQGDTLDERLYDRDNGQGAALKAIQGLR